MALYLSRHTCPDIACVVNSVARYMFFPKKLHNIALKCLGQYLKAIQDKGLILTTSAHTLKIDTFLDNDFAGLYGHEKKNNDPVCVKS